VCPLSKSLAEISRRVLLQQLHSQTHALPNSDVTKIKSLFALPMDGKIVYLPKQKKKYIKRVFNKIFFLVFIAGFN